MMQQIAQEMHRTAKTVNHGRQVVRTMTTAETATEASTESIVPFSKVFKISKIWDEYGVDNTREEEKPKI
jgi:hypothetical protein